MTAAEMAHGIRASILEQSKRAGVGHVGSSLSITEILAALFAGPLAGVRADDPDRHRLVLSKGHAVLALYAALHSCGRLSRAELDSFCADGSLLGGHPEHALAGIDFATGSLGHGLSLATGAAIAARLQGSERRAYAVMSDAELNEGAVWEAAMFAAHHRLANLIALVDVNGQQALGYTRDVLDLEPLGARWESFGWHVIEVDGHDLGALAHALDGRPVNETRPLAILARTTFGKGVSFMESQVEWHYWPMSDEQFVRAKAELAGSRTDD
jgi:transketolase